nr:DUF285 domain-containing protein [Ruminococcus sp.]
MFQMFNGCSNLQTIDLSCIIDTPSLTSTREMFQSCTKVENIDLSNWRNAQNLAVMQSMYYNCQKLKTVDLSSLVVSKLENCQQMFRDCFILEAVSLGNHITLNEYRTSNNSSGNGMMSMFINAGKNGTGMIVDLSGFDPTKIKNDSNGNPWGIGHMFSGCSKLTTVYVSDYWDNSNFSTQNSDWSQKNAFSGCNSLVGGAGTTYKANTNLNSYAKVDGGKDD